MTPYVIILARTKFNTEIRLISSDKKFAKKARTNKAITSPELRLIDSEGEQLGVVPLREALQMATDAGLDLVEISPGAKPPVCKIMDFGKYQYQQSKKAAASRKHQRQMSVKVIQMRPGTEKGDYDVKMNKVRNFLERGDKVKICIRFRGREMAHPDIGRKLMEQVRADIGELANVEQFPRLEGRQMVMVVAPKSTKK